MNNFSINPNFKMGGFENSIEEFNKVFSNSLNGAQKNLENAASFDEIFNSIGKTEPSLSGGIQTNNFELASIQKDTKNSSNKISPVAKMASDIGQGFSKSLNDLNTVDKQAETDFETFASGGDISVHDVMISAQKSSLAMQMAIQLRNQMLNAYNEFKSMSI